MPLMGTIRASTRQTTKGILWVAFSLGLFVLGDLIFGNPSDSPDGANHALAHLLTGIPMLLLALTAYRLWKPGNPILRVVRAPFILIALMLSAGQVEHSVEVYVGDPPHIVAKFTPSQVAVIGLGVPLAIGTLAKAWRSRIQHASS